MTRQSPEIAQFFLTAPSPCPYLMGRDERKLFTHIAGKKASALHQLLSEHGFRRSQNLVYRPACEGCQACRSVRVRVSEFEPGRRFRRIANANRDLTATRIAPEVTREQYDLFSRYLHERHQGGGMTQMSYSDYEFMVEDTPVSTFLVEYRFNDTSRHPGRLAAVALCDEMEDGYSMVYSFFDPDLSRRSPGNYMILESIGRARAQALPYVYLGYWVQGSPKMEYKAEFRPLEIQTEHAGWRLL